MKAADVSDDVFGSYSRLRSREWGGAEEGRNMNQLDRLTPKDI